MQRACRSPCKNASMTQRSVRIVFVVVAQSQTYDAIPPSERDIFHRLWWMLYIADRSSTCTENGNLVIREADCHSVPLPSVRYNLCSSPPLKPLRADSAPGIPPVASKATNKIARGFDMSSFYKASDTAVDCGKVSEGSTTNVIFLRLSGWRAARAPAGR
jgi:hypothetical protein